MKSTYITSIIPKEQKFHGIKDEYDYESICVFVALGFFLGNSTYYKNYKFLEPATDYNFENNTLVSTQKNFNWHYSPRTITFDQVLSEYKEILDSIICDLNDPITIPISGGLDSRTLLSALILNNKNIQGYSYEFENGHPETYYGEKIAFLKKFPFRKFVVSKGDLWKNIDKIGKINSCYAEFTNARQISFFDELSVMGGLFLLGHGGDLYFDNFGINHNLSDYNLMKILFTKLVKPSAFNLASKLWTIWGLKGDFKFYLESQLLLKLSEIKIENSNAKLRAFKSLHYVPRWTCVNIEIFKQFGNISIPYFENSFMKWVCTVPENYLANRKIQIEYLKRYSPELARIKWQAHAPYNLYNYRLNIAPLNYPIRLWNKILLKFNSHSTIQRNWELQFLGKENASILNSHLLNFESNLIPYNLRYEFLNKFMKQDSLYYFPSVTMLLTLLTWEKNEKISE